MTLDKMLATHDDAALVALTSKGLMRRARRDLEAGAGKIIARSADEATIETDGNTVVLHSKDVSSARCTCPASGTCRHILLAVLMLQASPLEDSNQSPEPPQSATDEITALTEAALQKFAGADWAPAQKLASQGMRIEDNGPSCKLSPEAADASITFIAGQGLKGAVYKGPRTRARVYVTAAALAIRAQAGIAISDAATAPDETVFDPAFCADVKHLLEEAVPATLFGSAEIAADALFDAAISARVGAAPRLAAQLRGLSNMAQRAATRDIAFAPTGFVEAAARCYGLALALTHSPEDPALTGSIQRTYRDADALDLWVTGTASWHTAAGARGLTVYLYDAQQQVWYRQVTARGAGQDLNFNPRGAYYGALWGVGSPERLKGSHLHLSAPKVSEDGQISATLSQPATRLDDMLSEDLLTEMAVRDWSVLRADLAPRMGRGLRRTPSPQPALIQPRRFGDLAFDDIAQAYRLPVIDRKGAVLELTISAETENTAPSLYGFAKDIVAMTIEAIPAEQGVTFRPVSVFLRDKKAIRTIDLDFAHFRQAETKTTLRDRVKALLHRSTPVEADRVSQLCNDTIELLVDALSVPVDGDRTQSRLQAAGLNTLAEATGRAVSSRTARDVMAAVYLAAELRMELSA